MTAGSASLLTAFLALVFVILLAYGLARVLRLTRLGQLSRPGRRLSVTETLYIDPKHSLLLVRCDNWEAVILTGPAGDTLLHRREDTP